MHASLDPLDPNLLDLDWQFRMYAGENADVACLVDEEDYCYFTQWLWVTKPSAGGKKLYFRRAVNRYDLTGQREGADTLYLHIEICRRAHGEMPTKRRCIVDHFDGDSLNNCRANLRWATSRENNRNRFGAYYRQRSLL